jgi:hypothetical protein
VREKPILFNTEMVRAILEGRKTMTRRVVKPQPDSVRRSAFVQSGFETCHGYEIKIPYKPGDTLWVRETWNTTDDCGLYPPWPSTGKHYMYLADAPESEEAKNARWRPSIHMPREAARLFLTVKNVRVERLQEILCNDMLAEGCIPEKVTGGQWQQWQRDYFKPLWNSIYSKPKAVIDHETLEVTHYVSYPWENIQETREYKGKPWLVVGNPWVLVIEFKREAVGG